ncbi:GIP, partial [Symbiodinium pilosum]
KGRRPHTAHFTENDDLLDSEDDDPDHEDGETGVPEEVAVAYATYQTAKQKYKEHQKSRGFNSYHAESKGETVHPGKANEKIKLMKAKSFCSGCGRHVPLLLSRTVLGKLGMVFDIERGQADFNKVGLKGFDLHVTFSGHPAIPILPTKMDGDPGSFQAEDLKLVPKSEYIAFAVAHSAGHVKSRELYNFFYDKKLEANRMGVLVHHSWGVTEIKACIMEAREAAKNADPTERMKRISHMNMPEDSLNTPDQELMKIGKFKGYEIPQSYG